MEKKLFNETNNNITISSEIKIYLDTRLFLKDIIDKAIKLQQKY